MARAYTNFAKSTLASGISAAATSLTVQTGDGALFPAAGGGTTFDLVIFNTSAQREIVSVTNRAGDVFTIVRAQQGTTALAWNAGDGCGHRLTADALNNILFSANMQENTPTWCGTAGGSANALTLTPTPAITAYVAGHRFIFKSGAAANTASTTVAISGLATKAIQNNGVALVAGDIEASKWYEILYDGAAFQLNKFSLSIEKGLLTAIGDIIYASAVGTPAVLPASTAGTLLTSQGPATAPAWVPPPPVVRQTQRFGAVDSSGYNNTFSAGAGLNFNVDATPTNAVFDFANGVQDNTAIISADASNQGTLVASNINFLSADYVSPSSVTWGSYLVPPQYGYAFDRTQGALLNFEGADTSTTMIDGFGNSWSAVGNAQIDTAQFKFDTSSLLLDGTGDYITSTDFTTLGDGSWEMQTWFRINSLPGAGTDEVIWKAANAAGFGATITLQNTAGTVKCRLLLSSTGTSWDVANQFGTNTTWALNQWNRFRVVFDALAGTYRVYLSLNGAAETQDNTVSSTARVCAISMMRIGANESGTENLDGWIDGFRFIRAATKTGTETPSASAPTITDYPVHFFSVPEMKMYEVTAASASAGTNPTLTRRDRLFVGEADTNGSAVTAVRNYALRGEAIVKHPAGLAASSSVNLTHNLGVPAELQDHVLMATASKGVSGFVPGDAQPVMALYNNGVPYGMLNPVRARGRNTARVTSLAGGLSFIADVTYIDVSATLSPLTLVSRRAF